MKTLLRFGILQIQCCLFPAVIFSTLAITKYIPLPLLPRYDLILLVCILTQVLMVLMKFETLDELWIICLFHIIGLILEIFKTHMGSWTYPEFSYAKIASVPLYSGFMYASVAGYVCQACRRLRLTFSGWPHTCITFPLICAIYANFFTHHFIYNFRWIILAATVLVFIKTHVQFCVGASKHKMPMSIAFLLVGAAIWVAENISTFFSAWVYPVQEKVWRIVPVEKIISWFLFALIAIVLVVNLKHLRKQES